MRCTLRRLLCLVILLGSACSREGFDPAPPCEGCSCGDCSCDTDADCQDLSTCTLDSCDPGAHQCLHVPQDAQCDDGLFCDGVERCDPAATGHDAATGCVAGVDPC